MRVSGISVEVRRRLASSRRQAIRKWEGGRPVFCLKRAVKSEGESRADRVGLIHELSMIAPHPESVTINALVPIAGTPLDKSEPITAVELARAIAVARIVMPASWVRLSAGRENMTEEGQALCLAAGANSIFVGARLLTTANPEANEDEQLLDTLGLEWGPRSDKPVVNA